MTSNSHECMAAVQDYTSALATLSASAGQFTMNESQTLKVKGGNLTSASCDCFIHRIAAKAQLHNLYITTRTRSNRKISTSLENTGQEHDAHTES